jgi:hypothetical protein
MRQKLFQITFITAAIFFCLSCRSNSKIETQNTGEKSKLSAEVFESLDYNVKNFGEGLPGEWLKTQFQTLWTRGYQIKRRTSVKEQADTFPRYTVVEEVYETGDLAANRLKRIQEKPPNLPVEEQEYWIVTGFQHQKNVYFVQTDSVLFSYYMKDFAAKLNEKLQQNQ